MTPHGEPPDVVEFGPPRPGRRVPRWAVPLLVLLLVAGAAVVARRAGDKHPSAVAPPSPPLSISTGPPPSSAPIITEELGRPLLGVTAGWELFGRGTDTVVRIEMARGRITRTTVPPSGSSGPLSFIVGRNWAVVRPLDAVSGLLVTDGQLPIRAAGALGTSGPAFPGPDPNTLWAPAANNAAAMNLVKPDGSPTGVSIAMPDIIGGAGGAEPDGTGYLLVRSTGGAYLARPDGLRRITTGDVLAVGPSRWLTLECDDRHRCTPTVIDRNTGTRHGLTGLSVGESGGVTGAVSPDGAVAALYEADPNGTLGLHLIRLDTGTDRRVDVTLGQYPEVGSVVWSPDSRWLFVAGGGGHLYPVEAATGRPLDLGVQLPPVTHVAIRA